MAQNKKHITPDNVTEWLASLGYLLPRNEVELERFEKLYEDDDMDITGMEIDPDKIIDGTFRKKNIFEIPDEVKKTEMDQYRMAARNGNKLPDHIMNKIQKNQNKAKDDSTKPENPDK